VTQRFVISLFELKFGRLNTNSTKLKNSRFYRYGSKKSEKNLKFFKFRPLPPYKYPLWFELISHPFHHILLSSSHTQYLHPTQAE
jgi:hypothetical protein